MNLQTDARPVNSHKTYSIVFQETNSFAFLGTKSFAWLSVKTMKGTSP